MPNHWSMTWWQELFSFSPETKITWNITMLKCHFLYNKTTSLIIAPQTADNADNTSSLHLCCWLNNKIHLNKISLLSLTNSNLTWKQKILLSKWPQFNVLLIFNPLTVQKKINEFLRQLASCIQIAGIANNDRHQYLHLHLKGGAITFFDQLPQTTREDYDLAVAALRER